MTFKKQLAQRLKYGREALGLTQSDLARRTKIHQGAISHFESGRRSPNVQNLAKLAKALLIRTDYLLGLSPY